MSFSSSRSSISSNCSNCSLIWNARRSLVTELVSLSDSLKVFYEKCLKFLLLSPFCQLSLKSDKQHHYWQTFIYWGNKTFWTFYAKQKAFASANTHTRVGVLSLTNCSCAAAKPSASFVCRKFHKKVNPIWHKRLLQKQEVFISSKSRVGKASETLYPFKIVIACCNECEFVCCCQSCTRTMCLFLYSSFSLCACFPSPGFYVHSFLILFKTSKILMKFQSFRVLPSANESERQWKRRAMMFGGTNRCEDATNGL